MGAGPDCPLRGPRHYVDANVQANLAALRRQAILAILVAAAGLLKTRLGQLKEVVVREEVTQPRNIECDWPMLPWARHLDHSHIRRIRRKEGHLLSRVMPACS